MTYFLSFETKYLNFMCILHLEPVSLRTPHVADPQQPHLTQGYRTAQFLTSVDLLFIFKPTPCLELKLKFLCGVK